MLLHGLFLDTPLILLRVANTSPSVVKRIAVESVGGNGVMRKTTMYRPHGEFVGVTEADDVDD